MAFIHFITLHFFHLLINWCLLLPPYLPVRDPQGSLSVAPVVHNNMRDGHHNRGRELACSSIQSPASIQCSPSIICKSGKEARQLPTRLVPGLQALQSDHWASFPPGIFPICNITHICFLCILFIIFQTHIFPYLTMQSRQDFTPLSRTIYFIDSPKQFRDISLYLFIIIEIVTYSSYICIHGFQRIDQNRLSSVISSWFILLHAFHAGVLPRIHPLIPILACRHVLLMTLTNISFSLFMV